MNLAMLLVYSGAVFVAAMLGAWIPRRVEMTHTRTQMMLSLVSGLMLGVAIFHLLPHSVAVTGDLDVAMRWLMLGLVFTLLMLRMFQSHHHGIAEDSHCDGHGGHHDHDHDHSAQARDIGWIGVFVGFAIHTIIDGVALGAVMRTESLAGGLVGFGVFLAILLHKPMDALAIETTMATAGWSDAGRRRANWLFALLCPLAAVGFYFGLDLSQSAGAVMPAALSFSAGAFICIALGDLLPEVQFHSHDRVKLTLFFLGGIGLAFAIGWLEPGHLH